jgi:hypothetical protein
MADDIAAEALEVFKRWYLNLRIVPQNKGPAKGTIGGALLLLDNLQEDYNLDSAANFARGETQIRGQSGAAVARILKRYGERRKYLSEGGRTNRGLRTEMIELLDALKALNLEALPTWRRSEVLETLQQFLVERVQDYHKQQRLQFYYDPQSSGWTLINSLLRTAAQEAKEGPVAQHLVGAKLQLRFPKIHVSNQSYSTADVQTGRPGDFIIADTVFHVTVAPLPGVYDKCRANLRQGLRPYLLVPNRVAVGAKQNADAVAPGNITVAPIESFVSQNIEELSSFSKGGLVEGFRALLTLYNERVDAVEFDKSLLIELPHDLSS